MADLRNRMRNHVKAAKIWLGKAEQSFDEENEIRGDLNLMLARAELERARETKGPNKKNDMHGILAAGVAALLLAVGFSGFVFRDAKPATSVIPAKTVKQAAPLHLQQNAEKYKGEPQQADPHLTESAQAAPAESTEVKPEIDIPPRRNVTRTPEPVVDLPPVQMQQLMRAAGKSLRGQ